MDFKKEMPNLLSLIAFIVFNYSIGVKNTLIGFVNEIGKVGIVLTQKQWELSHAIVSYAILNPHAPLLASYSYYPFQSVPNVILSQPSGLTII